MTPEQVALVQRSWQQVVPIADDVARLFYRRLFEIDASTVRLFADTDMAAQRNKFLQVWAMAVSGLDHLDRLVPVVADLGRRHVGYGVTDAHYASVRRALLTTLAEGLADDWTPELGDAWAATYDLLADTMRKPPVAA